MNLGRVSLAAGSAALALHALLPAALLLDARGDPTVLLCVGEKAPLAPGVAEPVRFASQFGYDGQYYAQVALDPLDRRATSPVLDDSGKRFGRILLPGLARLLGARDLRSVALAFAALNLLGAAAAAALVAAARGGGSGAFLAGVAAGAQTGFAVAIARGLPGPLGAALVLAAMALRERERPVAAGACLALAPLDHEIYAVVPAAIAIHGLARGRLGALLGLLSLAPFLAWRASLALRGLHGAVPFADLGVPPLAALASAGKALRFRGFLPEEAFAVLLLAAFLLLPFALLLDRREPAPGTALWVAAACADRDVWIAFWSSSRATAPAFALGARAGSRLGLACACAGAAFTPAMAAWFALFPPDLILP